MRPPLLEVVLRHVLGWEDRAKERCALVWHHGCG